MTSPKYVTRADGSIDYGYYKRRGRTMRSEAVREASAGIGGVLGALFIRLVRRASSLHDHGKAVLSRGNRMPTPLDTRS